MKQKMNNDGIKLLDETKKEVRSQLFWAKLNNVTEINFTILAIVFSALATVLSALGNSWATYLAALPALLAMLQKVVDFRGKAVQYYLTARRYTSVERSLEFGGMSEKEAVLTLNKIDEEMEKRWLEVVKEEKKIKAYEMKNSKAK